MLLLSVTDCAGLLPILKLLRKGVVPLIQIGIIAVLIVLLIIDFGKAVMAGKEDEIKSAQKLAIKRIVYALVVFLVPWIVNIAIGLLAKTEEPDLQENVSYKGNQYSGWTCWELAGK